MAILLYIVECYRDNVQKGQASSEEVCLAHKDTLIDN